MRFYACVGPEAGLSGDSDDDAVFECTAWVQSHLMTSESARALHAVDAQKAALFEVEVARVGWGRR